MKWASAASVEPGLGAAVAEAARKIREALGSEPPDLVVLFVSQHHESLYDRAAELTAREIPSGLLLGCSAGGVIGGGKEIEQQPGLSITAAILPEVELAPFHVESDELPDPSASAWEALLGIAARTDPHFLLLADPFTFDAERFVKGLDVAFPRSRKVGGLASGGRQPGSNALYLGGGVYHAGLVGVGLRGNIEVDTIVAQGCRPIGLPMFITRCRQNVLFGLDDRPPIEVLQEIYQRLDSRDQELFHHSLFLGIVMDESRQEYRQGDFLIRNVVGMDSESGALAIGALLREGLVVQFHLRDAKTSAEDLSELLSRCQAESPRPEGSLLFSCLGRGASLYGRPDHDTDLFRRHLGEVPLGGFFCNGEIGPVHGTTFLHGYTSSFGLFRGRSKPAS